MMCVSVVPTHHLAEKTHSGSIERTQEAIVDYSASLRTANEVLPEETKRPRMIIIDVAA